MIKRVATLATVCVAILVLCAAVQAQPPKGKGGGPGGPGFFGSGMGGMGFGGNMSSMLLRAPKVQEELGLTEAQKTKIQAVMKEGMGERPDMGALRDLDEEQRKAKMAEFREKAEARGKKMAKDIDEALKPEQRKRLKQIQLQLRGVNALRDKEVATELGLSTEQQDKIAAIGKEAGEKTMKLFADREDRAGAMEKVQKIRKESETATLGLLTQEQKEKFEEMKGSKFEVDMASLFPGAGGGRKGPGAKGKERAKPKEE